MISELSELLVLQLRAAGVDGFTQEYRFHPARRWRFDVAWPAQRIAVEVDGGQWIPGTGEAVRAHGELVAARRQP